ncbi:MAG TPA: TOBE domain-containing protein, partial [Candidatus Synoicihabitans sp.]|nr:TOBE domain-containing protein [Candidatus Synoicihabitans sp.]
MGDRICVMKDGRIMQVAEPLELYNHPANLFVAGFIGSPPMNFFKGTVQRDGGRLWFIEANAQGAPLRIALDDRLARLADRHAGQPLVFGIRPEDVQDLNRPDGDPATSAEVNVEVSEPMGSETYLYLSTPATSFIARVRPTDRYDAGQRIRVAFDVAKAHLFDAASEAVLK